MKYWRTILCAVLLALGGLAVWASDAWKRAESKNRETAYPAASHANATTVPVHDVPPKESKAALDLTPPARSATRIPNVPVAPTLDGGPAAKTIPQAPSPTRRESGEPVIPTLPSRLPPRPPAANGASPPALLPTQFVSPTDLPPLPRLDPPSLPASLPMPTVKSGPLLQFRLWTGSEKPALEVRDGEHVLLTATCDRVEVMAVTGAGSSLPRVTAGGNVAVVGAGIEGRCDSLMIAPDGRVSLRGQVRLKCFRGTNSSSTVTGDEVAFELSPPEAPARTPMLPADSNPATESR